MSGLFMYDVDVSSSTESRMLAGSEGQMQQGRGTQAAGDMYAGAMTGGARSGAIMQGHGVQLMANANRISTNHMDQQAMGLRQGGGEAEATSGDAVGMASAATPYPI